MESGTKLLMASAAGAVNTANAYRPLGRKAPATIPSFIASVTTTEFPLQTIVSQQLSTAGFALRGALSSRSGRIGLLLSAVSWAALANLYREATRAEPVLESALVAGLGPDYRSRIAAPLLPPVDVPLTRTQIALPKRGSRRRYLRLADQSYGEFGKANYLDIWGRPDLPSDPSAPVLLQIPGGAWVTGRKTGQAYPLLSHLAERGWVCVAINYRLSPHSVWPAHIVDVKHAIDWVKRNIAEHGGDPNFIAVTGGSAGGHLTALAALTPGLAEFQPGFEEADTTVQAAVPFYGIYDFVDEDGLGVPELRQHLEGKVLQTKLADDRANWELASPEYHIGPQAPPFFVVQGANDILAKPAQARRFVGDLRKQSARPVVYAELPYAQHSFDVGGSVRSVHTVRAVERFLDYVYCTTREETGPTP
jgi:acetyl esterase/lipase